MSKKLQEIFVHSWKQVLPLSLVASVAFWVNAVAPSQAFAASASREMEKDEVAKMVEQQMGLCSAPVTEGFLREVGGRLAKETKDPRGKFSFQIVDQAEPNAFAIPGGGLYVSRGLLTLVNREDELAGVLGHEMAHVTERHSARQQSRGFLPGLLSMPGKVVGGVVSEDSGRVNQCAG